MLALSIKQPWAWLIVNGIKTVENRKWYTEHRGGLLIHASKNQADLERDLATVQEKYGVRVPREELVFGQVIGMVNLIGCTKEPEEKTDRHWHIENNFAWILREPRLIKPFPYSGRLMLFEVPWSLEDYHDLVEMPSPWKWR